MSGGKNSKSGSAILIVILVMSALLYSGFALFQTTTLTMDFVYKRQEREQKARIVQGILNYGIDLCTKRFTKFALMAQEGNTQWTFDLGKWGLETGSIYDTQLCVSWQEEKLHLYAKIYQQGRCVFTVACNLERKIEKGEKKKGHHFLVQEWRENA